MSNETKEGAAVALPMDAASIAANITAYGLEWSYASLNRQPDGKGPKTLLRANVPHLGMPETVEAIMLVAKYFPQVIYAGNNGTSLRVRGQGVARPFIEANTKATDDEIKQHLVSTTLLGVTTRTVGNRTKYIGVDGKEYATLAEAQGSVKAAPVVSDVDLAAAFIADAVDMLTASGMNPKKAFAVAREKALAKFPGAFTTPEADAALSQ